jgi:hypothetical protein
MSNKLHVNKTSVVAGYNASESASEMTITPADIANVAAEINAAIADKATLDVFNAAYNKARASGLSENDSLADAWGYIKSNGTRLANGQVTVTGALNPFVESPDQPAGLTARRYGDGAKAAGMSLGYRDALAKYAMKTQADRGRK